MHDVTRWQRKRKRERVDAPEGRSNEKGGTKGDTERLSRTSPVRRYYPLKLVIFGKYRFEKPITLFPHCEISPR